MVIGEEGNDKFETEESDAAVAADDDDCDHDDETTPRHGRYDGWCAAVGTWSSFSRWIKI